MDKNIILGIINGLNNKRADVIFDEIDSKYEKLRDINHSLETVYENSDSSDIMIELLKKKFVIEEEIREEKAAKYVSYKDLEMVIELINKY